ncbi:restriction endonuclease subunit S [Paenibacillus chitinolyticus]|uniref:restriction endonuclease subunit S n=1 Tax=Paenibacillus chitinolyticus TaxID=79263 RepID=UPI00364490B7
MSRKMRDSGIEWIGEVPEDWEITKVKYLAIVAPKCATSNFTDTTEVTFAPMECIKNGYYLRRTANFKNYNSSYNMFETGDIAIAKVTPCFENGNIAIMDDLVNGFGFGSSELFILRCYRGNSKFLYYYLQNVVFIDRGKSIMTGTGGLKRISAEFIKNYYVCLPNEVDQQRIVDYLDLKSAEIERIILNTRTSIEDYKAFKQSIITEAVIRGLNPNFQMKNSGIDWIGEIPKHWRITRVKYLLDESKEKSIEGNEVPLSMSQQFGIIKSSDLDIPNTASSYIGGKLVYKDYLVFNKLKAHLGVFAVSSYDGVVSPDYAVYVGKDGVHVKFLEYLFKTQKCIQQFKKYIRGVGAGLSRLYTSDLFNIEIALPNYDEQIAITEYIEKRCIEIDHLISQKQKLVSELETYKKILIYECVTGKKEV